MHYEFRNAVLVTETAADRWYFSWSFKGKRQSKDVAVCFSLKNLRIQYRRLSGVVPTKIANLVEFLS